MVFLILIGASIFSLVFRGYEGDELVQAYLSSVPGGVVGFVIVVMLAMFLLGFVLDFIEITFVVVPIGAPIILALGVDPVWLGILIAINLQTSFLTPPFGFALFYLRGVAPESIETKAIYKGALPFVAIELSMLLLIALFPELVPGCQTKYTVNRRRLRLRRPRPSLPYLRHHQKQKQLQKTTPFDRPRYHRLLLFYPG